MLMLDNTLIMDMYARMIEHRDKGVWRYEYPYPPDPKRKKIVYIDMDQTINHFMFWVKTLNPNIEYAEDVKAEVDKTMQANRRMFLDIPLLEDAVEAIELLKPHFEIYFLSTPVWEIHESWGDKKTWLEKHFGEFATKRLILTHRKDLARGEFLVDDSTRSGADEFKGVHILFGSPAFPDWRTVTTYLLNNK